SAIAKNRLCTDWAYCGAKLCAAAASTSWPNPTSAVVMAGGKAWHAASDAQHPASIPSRPRGATAILRSRSFMTFIASQGWTATQRQAQFARSSTQSWGWLLLIPLNDRTAQFVLLAVQLRASITL